MNWVRAADVLIVVSDITNYETYCRTEWRNCPRMLEMSKKGRISDLPVVLVGNKRDLEEKRERSRLQKTSTL